MGKICFLSCFFNPADFRRNVQNCEDFIRYTVGTAFPIEDFYFCQVKSDKCRSIDSSLTKKGNYLELNSESVLWHKERCFNLLIKKFNLYNKYEWICWVDADIVSQKRISIPENCRIFQPFNISCRAKDNKKIDLTKPFLMNGIFADSYAKNPDGDKGLSWAIKSNLLKSVGGFFDYGIVGGGDSYFLNKMVGNKYSIGCKDFDDELDLYFKDLHIDKKEIGYLENTFYHLWHGKMSNRQYNERINILRKNKFSPLDDLIVEKSGLYRLINPAFEAEVKQFFIYRDEDGN